MALQGPNDLLSINTVAAILEVDRKTVLAMWRRGQLGDPVNLGTGTRRHLRWRRCQIDVFLAGLTPLKPDQPGRKSDRENKGIDRD